MKLLRDIAPVDLDACPIWRYLGDDDERATVEPDETFRVDGSGGAWIAKTTFTLADGTVLPGYCSPIDDGIDYVQPVIIDGRRHVPLFSEAASRGVDAAAVANALGKTGAAVFPIRFECAPRLPDGSCLRGVVTPDGMDLTG
jgi:hypothetical protein